MSKVILIFHLNSSAHPLLLCFSKILFLNLCLLKTWPNQSLSYYVGKGGNLVTKKKKKSQILIVISIGAELRDIIESYHWFYCQQKGQLLSSCFRGETQEAKFHAAMVNA